MLIYQAVKKSVWFSVIVCDMHVYTGMPIFRYFPFFSVIFGLIRSPISSFSFWTFCLFLCPFSVRRHAHVDFQLFSQKSNGIRVYIIPCACVLTVQAGWPGVVRMYLLWGLHDQVSVVWGRPHSTWFYFLSAVYMTWWQCTWHGDSVHDMVTVYRTWWQCTWHGDSVHDMAVYMTWWQRWVTRLVLLHSSATRGGWGGDVYVHTYVTITIVIVIMGTVAACISTATYYCSVIQ